MIDVLKGTGAAAIVDAYAGRSRDMQSYTAYDDIVGDVGRSLCPGSRWRPGTNESSRLAMDQGIGFYPGCQGQSGHHSPAAGVPQLRTPDPGGTSRKGFIGRIVGGTPEERLTGSLVAATAAIMNRADVIPGT